MDVLLNNLQGRAIQATYYPQTRAAENQEIEVFFAGDNVTSSNQRFYTGNRLVEKIGEKQLVKDLLLSMTLFLVMLKNTHGKPLEINNCNTGKNHKGYEETKVIVLSKKIDRCNVSFWESFCTKCSEEIKDQKCSCER